MENGTTMNKENEFLLSKEEKLILDALFSLEMYPSANKEEEDDETKQGDILATTLENICKRGRLIHRLSSGKQTWIKDWEI
ncbi:MAG: hypothetical protein ACW991_04460, partial [Candidatus Hodarchaeales archaeon]